MFWLEDSTLKKMTIIAALLVSMPVASCFGAGIGLKEAVQRALERNNLLKAAHYEHSAASHETAASRSRILPRIILDETVKESTTPTSVFMMKLDE